jgi:hypothetical protein
MRTAIFSKMGHPLAKKKNVDRKRKFSGTINGAPDR